MVVVFVPVVSPRAGIRRRDGEAALMRGAAEDDIDRTTSRMATFFTDRTPEVKRKRHFFGKARTGQQPVNEVLARNVNFSGSFQTDIGVFALSFPDRESGR